MISETKRAYNRQYWEQNRERLLAYHAAYRDAHRERINARQTVYRDAHREQVREYDRLHPRDRNSYMREWSEEHAEYRRQMAVCERLSLRVRVLQALGDVCVRCGFDDPRALQIDHVNGGGRADIVRLGLGRGNTPKYLRHVLEEIEAESGKFQLLCANCNAIKRIENREQVSKHHYAVDPLSLDSPAA